MMMSSMRPTEWGMLILLSIFWGGSFFFVEIALRDFQPFTVVFLRVALAALILLGVGVLGEVIRILEYTGMGCIFLGLILIDGRVLNWIRKRLNIGPQIGYHLNIQKGK
jgi:drug/metabolite transporter (DMT)-like permease